MMTLFNCMYLFVLKYELRFKNEMSTFPLLVVPHIQPQELSTDSRHFSLSHFQTVVAESLLILLTLKNQTICN